MLRHALTVTIMAFASLTAGAPAGTAATGSGSDPKGDAPAYVDITRLKVSNSPDRVSFKVKVKDLRSTGTFIVSMYDPNGGSAGMDAKVTHRKATKAKVKVTNTDFDDVFGVDCPGARGTWKAARNVLKVSVPQSCYHFYEGPPAAWDVWATAKGTKPGQVDRTDIFQVVRG